MPVLPALFPSFRHDPPGKVDKIMNIRRLTSVNILLICTTFLSSFSPVLQAQDTLYSRLGGYDAVAAVVDDLMGRLAEDEQVGRVLEHIPDTRFRDVRQRMVDFLCETTGGPCIYRGKDMLTAHRGMGLTDSDWKKTVVHLKATLNKFNVPSREKTEVLQAISSLKSAIVDKQHAH